MVVIFWKVVPPCPISHPNQHSIAAITVEVLPLPVKQWITATFSSSACSQFSILVHIWDKDKVEEEEEEEEE